MLRELNAVTATLSATNVWLAALRLCDLAAKAGFNRDQPRVKPGYREGGQWTRDGSGTPSVPKPNLRFDEEGNPQLPATRPETRRDRNRLSKQLAKWAAKRAGRAIPILRILEAAEWLLENGFDILSYQDPPQTLEFLRARTALYRRIGRTPLGYEKHHIVEEEAARRAGFPEEAIQDLENVVVIPKYRHHDVTSWFMTRNKDYGGLSPREYLRDKSWAERRKVGLKALEINGVLQP